MLTIRELEILKAALEGDIMVQKDYLDEYEYKPSEFVEWLIDSEKLLKKVSLRLSKELSTDTGVEYLRGN